MREDALPVRRDGCGSTGALGDRRRGSWSPSREDMQTSPSRSTGSSRRAILGAPDIMARDRREPGVLLSTVVATTRGGGGGVHLAGDISPCSGDGLAFFRRPRGGGGGRPRHPRREERYGPHRCRRPVRAGARVFLTKSADLEQAKRIMANLPQTPIDIRSLGGRQALLGSGFRCGGEPLRVLYRADIVMEPADRPLTGSRSQNTSGRPGAPFTVRKMDLRYPGGLFSR